MRPVVRLLAVLVGVVALLGCGGDDDADAGAANDTESTEGNDPDDPEASRPLDTAGDAAAAQGSGLEEAPGLADRVPFGDFGEVAIAITAPDGSVLGWCVLLADAPELRERGLMEVTELGGYAGMLFVWDADSASSFYMRNTRVPLSIAWFDADGELVSDADMEPCPDEVENCPNYPAAGPYRFALEVPQNNLAELGVGEGSLLRVGGACAPG
jgi:uncharacterized membrane protein (UPF0127 family)